METILAFGYHDRESPRHWTVCDALKKEGAQIVECHTVEKGLFGKLRDLGRKFRDQKDIDAVLVPFPGHFLMPFAWWLTRAPRKRLIFDAFISLYDTDVLDRRRFSRWNPWSWFLFFIDWLSMHLADEVLIDTEAHKKFLMSTFHLQPSRIKVIYLEARPDLFYPAERLKTTGQNFEVFFYGTLIPLQGVEYILEAARILERKSAAVHFTFVGTGKLKELIESAGLRSVTIHSFIPLSELPDFIRNADLCLGIFGTSGKAQRVIPHKVIDAVACGIPVLTADTPALRERFEHHPLVHTVPAGNAEAIANAIIVILSGAKDEEGGHSVAQHASLRSA